MSKPKKLTVADYITHQIKLSGVPQTDIAVALNYDKPNVITMIKQGKTKLPLNKVGPLAKVLGVDPIHLFRLAMEEYRPEDWEAICGIVGDSMVTTEEMRLIHFIREQTDGQGLSLEKVEHRAALGKAISEIVAE